MLSQKLLSVITAMTVGCSVFAATEFANFKAMEAAAKAAKKAKDYEKERSIYEAWYKKTKLDSEKWICFFNAAFALQNMKKYDDAIKRIDAYIATKPAESYVSVAYFLKGGQYYSKRDYKQALANYTKALEYKKIPQWAKKQSEIRIPYCYFSDKNYEKCIETAKPLLDPKKTSYYDQAYRISIMSYYNLKKYDESEKLIKKALPIVKNKYERGMITFYYAEILIKNGKKEEAKKYLQETAKLVPNLYFGRRANQLLKNMK